MIPSARCRSSSREGSRFERVPSRLPTRSINGQRYAVIPKQVTYHLKTTLANGLLRPLQSAAITIFSSGGERGGHDAEAFYSLVSSAKMNGVEPFAWLPVKVLVSNRQRNRWSAARTKTSSAANRLTSCVAMQKSIVNPETK